MVTEEPRRWRLRGFNADKVLIHDEICVGDHLLEFAVLELEARPDFHRRVVDRESKLGNRPAFSAPVPPPPPKPDRRICTECELTEPECLKRARVNGHDFTPPAPPVQPEPADRPQALEGATS